MKTDATAIQEVTAFRESLYRFFSECLLRSPDHKILAVWGDLEWRAALMRLLDLPQTSLPIEPQLTESKELAAEHASLFHVPATQTCPFESFYRVSASNLGPSELGARRSSVAASVLQIYSAWGLRPELVTGEVPDHIATELLFMAMLVSLESYLRAEEDERLVKAVLRAQKDFLDKHILAWLPAWVVTVRARARSAFYRSVIGILERFLEVDRNALDSMVGLRS